MTFRPALGRVLLALLLVFTGEQALRHELQHAFERLEHQSPRDHPQHDVCATCVAFSALHHLAGVANAVAPVIPVRHARPLEASFRSTLPRFPAAYLSRAPPSLPA